MAAAEHLRASPARSGPRANHILCLPPLLLERHEVAWGPLRPAHRRDGLTPWLGCGVGLTFFGNHKGIRSCSGFPGFLVLHHGVKKTTHKPAPGCKGGEEVVYCIRRGEKRGSRAPMGCRRRGGGGEREAEAAGGSASSRWGDVAVSPPRWSQGASPPAGPAHGAPAVPPACASRSQALRCFCQCWTWHTLQGGGTAQGCARSAGN